jgi:hypothetical protein
VEGTGGAGTVTLAAAPLGEASGGILEGLEAFIGLDSNLERFNEKMNY